MKRCWCSFSPFGRKAFILYGFKSIQKHTQISFLSALHITKIPWFIKGFLHIKGENLKAKGRYRLYGKESSSQTEKEEVRAGTEKNLRAFFVRSSNGKLWRPGGGYTARLYYNKIDAWRRSGKNRQHQAVDYDSKGRKIYDSDESRNLTANGRHRIITEMPWLS